GWAHTQQFSLFFDAGPEQSSVRLDESGIPRDGSADALNEAYRHHRQTCRVEASSPAFVSDRPLISAADDGLCRTWRTSGPLLGDGRASEQLRTVLGSGGHATLQSLRSLDTRNTAADFSTRPSSVSEAA
ncbi:hypothetical protein V5799_016595, partial [Amblyomma americanum]